MRIRKLTHIVLLLAAMQALSAYKIRCWWFCTDQTAIQNNYVSDRDSCQHYATLRIETDTSNPELLDERLRKSKMLALFSSCMADKGWTVPDGKTAQQAAAPVPVGPGVAPPTTPSPTAAPVAPVVAGATAAPAASTATNAAVLAAKQREKAFLHRSSECSFARHGAAYSSVSAARAKACDIECEQRLKAAPDSPRPAACPADPDTIVAPM